jgi:hypothetical protein
LIFGLDAFGKEREADHEGGPNEKSGDPVFFSGKYRRFHIVHDSAGKFISRVQAVEAVVERNQKVVVIGG